MNPVHLEARQPVETVNVTILKRVVNPKRIIAAAIVLGFGLGLASCGGGAGPTPSQFSDYVADHWPRWAGGMPGDVPPRPGAPGYEEFIAHGQANKAAQGAPPPAAPGQKAAAATKTIAQPAPAVAAAPAAPVAPVEPVAEEPAENSSVVHGGLY